jgi:hypothetical protein
MLNSNLTPVKILLTIPAPRTVPVNKNLDDLVLIALGERVQKTAHMDTRCPQSNDRRLMIPNPINLLNRMSAH